MTLRVRRLHRCLQPLPALRLLLTFCLLAWPIFGMSQATSAADPLWVAAGEDGEPRIQLWFYWSRGCPHCLDARPFVLELADSTPWLQLQERELSAHPEHVRQYLEMAAALDRQARYVPAFLFCRQMYVGWDSAAGMGAHVRRQLNACRENLAAEATTTAVERPRPDVSLPLLGDLDNTELSLPVLTLIVAGLDAFNPCAFFVLLFLLSLLVHLRDRRRMLLIGGLYVVVSGVMYFAFMAAWLNVFLVVGNLPWITAAAGGLAIGLGGINIKDFFAFKQGLTLSVSERHMTDIFRRARNVLAAGNLPAMLAATLVLAAAANLYELLCTAGFPMVYTRLLTLHSSGGIEQYLWLALYNIIYVLPLLIIVLIFTRTLGGGRLSERRGRLLKLLSGLMMLGLGIILLAAPALLNNVAVAAGLLAVALLLTWIAARLSRP